MNEKELFCKLFPEYAVNGKPLSPYFDLFESGYEQAEKRIAELEEVRSKQAELINKDIIRMENQKYQIEKLEKENADLKVKVGLSIDCEKAQKDGELCLGYGGDEDEPCERCKNCIKCECGYYQLGETEKDEQLTKAKTLLKRFVELENCTLDYDDIKEAEQFLSEVEK